MDIARCVRRVGVTTFVILWSMQNLETALGTPASTRPPATPLPSDNEPEEEETEEGDMLDFSSSVLSGSVYKSALLMREYLWPDGTMYYRFDANLTIWLRKQVRKAMKNIEQQSCIRFVMYKPGMDIGDWYELEPASYPWMCASSVALICKNASLNCRHRMLLGEDCPLGSLVHELMHALGFVHEQSRHDRDDYVIVHSQNVKPGYTRQFEKYRFPLRNLAPYDYESIMHYDPYAFTDPSKNLPTIQTKLPLPEGVQLGQRSKLSRYDIEKLNTLYNCPATKAKRASVIALDAAEDPSSD